MIQERLQVFTKMWLRIPFFLAYGAETLGKTSRPLKINALCSIETSVNYHLVTRLHIPVKRIPQTIVVHYCRCSK